MPKTIGPGFEFYASHVRIFHVTCDLYVRFFYNFWDVYLILVPGDAIDTDCY